MYQLLNINVFKLKKKIKQKGKNALSFNKIFNIITK